MMNQWDSVSLTARIEDKNARQRYEAGCPNRVEVEAYAKALPQNCLQQTAIVLGMTPELRLLAVKFFQKIITVDYSLQAIQIYTDWLPPLYRWKETIINGNWLELKEHLSGPVSVIMGDGIFGNLQNIEQHNILLSNIASSLLPGGTFITRMAVIPEGFEPDEHTAERLIDRFRRGEISESEFGFDMRLLGHYKCCYDKNTFILDNAKLFKECENFLHCGKISQGELSLIRRYYFPGNNCIIPQGLWEKLLREQNFEFKIQHCTGRSWYEYYKVYKCSLVSRRRQSFHTATSTVNCSEV